MHLSSRLTAAAHLSASPLRWLNGQRHAKGFGIHSPFAFALVTQTLHHPRGYAYYRERDVARSWRWLFRLGMLPIHRCIFFAGKLPAEALKAVKSIAVTRALPILTSLSNLPGDALIVVADGANEAALPPLASLLKSGSTIVMLRLRPTEEVLSEAMSFVDRKKSVHFGLPHLPRQSFTLSF